MIQLRMRTIPNNYESNSFFKNRGCGLHMYSSHCIGSLGPQQKPSLISVLVATRVDEFDLNYPCFDVVRRQRGSNFRRQHGSNFRRQHGSKFRRQHESKLTSIFRPLCHRQNLHISIHNVVEKVKFRSIMSSKKTDFDP